MKLSYIIQNGESRTVEFKREIPRAGTLAKTILSFTNGAGGYLFIGVEDNGKIIGINEDDIFELKDTISNIIHDLCYPTIIPDIFLEKSEDDKQVLVVHIFPGSLKPYYLKKLGKAEGTYIRVGATNKKADTALIQQLERERLNISP